MRKNFKELGIIEKQKKTKELGKNNEEMNLELKKSGSTSDRFRIDPEPKATRSRRQRIDPERCALEKKSNENFKNEIGANLTPVIPKTLFL